MKFNVDENEGSGIEILLWLMELLEKSLGLCQ